MFNSLNGGIRLYGTAGSLLWGYHEAATFRRWKIFKNEQNQWTLRATLARVDAFQLRQRPLFFSAPRAQGFWCWGVDGAVSFDAVNLIVRLGPPEQ